jgi:hypothetical protein
MAELCRAMQGPAWRLVYHPGADAKAFGDRFDLFCRAVYAAGDCTALVEELADVTSPSWAPPSWGRLNTSGRHRGVEVIACTQSPAYVDKKFLGGCTYIRCFTLRQTPHKRAMASALGVPFEEVDTLQTVEAPGGVEITFYERDFRSGDQGRYRVTLGKRGASAPVAVARPGTASTGRRARGT